MKLANGGGFVAHPVPAATARPAARLGVRPAGPPPRLPAECQKCPFPAESAGINLRPGSDDDGWVTPEPVHLSDGTTLHLFKDGEALRAAYDAIAAARSLVCLEVYILAHDETGRAFADLLCRKAHEGVRVYVIYDSFGCRGFIGSEPEMFRRMRRAGVGVRQFHPVMPWECQFSWRPGNRDHRKLLLVDHDLAGLGGLNIANEYAASWVVPLPEPPATASGPVTRLIGPRCRFWRDNAVGIRGPGAALFRRAFANTWEYVRWGGRIARAGYQRNLSEGELGVLSSVPTFNSPLRPSLLRLLRGARESVLLTMAYFAPDDGLIAELCRAARRGVRVRLMLPAICDVPAVRVAGRSFYETLLGCGVEVYEREGAVLHAKTVVSDARVSVIGSANLDRRSIQYNCELSAVIRSEIFARQMHDLFENDVRYATRIEPSEWRRRPVRDRLMQWAVSRARYLL